MKSKNSNIVLTENLLAQSCLKVPQDSNLKTDKLSNKSIICPFSTPTAYDNPNRKRKHTEQSKLLTYFKEYKQPKINLTSKDTNIENKPFLTSTSESLVNTVTFSKKDLDGTDKKSSSVTISSKGCKKVNCLTCGDVKILRGNPVIASTICDTYDFGLHYKSLSQLSRR